MVCRIMYMYIHVVMLCGIWQVGSGNGKVSGVEKVG